MTTRAEILVVGGGPAGLAAATVAARAGRSVAVLDDNPTVGGQIWRAGVDPAQGKDDRLKRRAVERFRASGAELFLGRRVIDAPTVPGKGGLLRAVVEDAAHSRIESFAWDRLILATGARERLLPFPGWTLPGVFGAGGLQALVKGGYSVRGKRVVVAGTGPLLLAVAAHLQEYGATVVSVAEQAGLRSLAPLAVRLCQSPARLLQGAKYRAALARVPYRIGCWPVAALGPAGSLTGVRLTDGRRTWTEPCDLLACGFHLVPNTELPALLGCALRAGNVVVDRTQQTTRPGVYCVGEPTGVAGLDAALLEGTIAGLEAAGKSAEAARLHQKRDRERRFGHALDRAFALRLELLRLAEPDTIVCRCEDVRYAQLVVQPGWTDAKLQTRCGMGACQGRICGPATHALFGWHNGSIRPPLFPVPLSAFRSAPAIALNEPSLQEDIA